MLTVVNTWLKFLLRISPGEINWLYLLLLSKPIFVDMPTVWCSFNQQQENLVISIFSQYAPFINNF